MKAARKLDLTGHAFGVVSFVTTVTWDLQKDVVDKIRIAVVTLPDRPTSLAQERGLHVLAPSLCHNLWQVRDVDELNVFSWIVLNISR